MYTVAGSWKITFYQQTRFGTSTLWTQHNVSFYHAWGSSAISLSFWQVDNLKHACESNCPKHNNWCCTRVAMFTLPQPLVMLRCDESELGLRVTHMCFIWSKHSQILGMFWIRNTSHICSTCPNCVKKAFVGRSMGGYTWFCAANSSKLFWVSKFALVCVWCEFTISSSQTKLAQDHSNGADAVCVEWCCQSPVDSVYVSNQLSWAWERLATSLHYAYSLEVDSNNPSLNSYSTSNAKQCKMNNKALGQGWTHTSSLKILQCKHHFG